jgi:iron complex outermembrane recepter protein
MSIPRGRHLLARALTVCVLAAPSLAYGQSSCGSQPIAGVTAHWPAPLDRTLAFRVRDVSLRDALSMLAAAAHVRLSYSPELLPLNRRVCVAYDSVSVGGALTALIGGSAVEPIVVGADHIALAPARVSAGSVPDTVKAGETTVLDRVVVTGNTTGAARRSLPVAMSILGGPEVERRTAEGTLSQVVNGSVPGLWVWEQAPTSLLARYASIRGASSFGVSYPKVYIDGIEVANPLLITQISPEMVDHVEVIRGPQGAALYGTDAISGVINIVTRNDGGADGGFGVTLRSDAGAAASDFVSRAPFTQNHALTLRAGSNVRSAGLGVSVGTVGAFVPDAYSRRLNATGSARVVGSRSIVTATARYFAEKAGDAVSPILSDSPFAPAGPPSGGPPPGGSPSPRPMSSDDPQSVQQYTVGASAKLVQSARWTYIAVVGLDGYRLANVADDARPIPLPADAGPSIVSAGADRGTVRLSSVAQWGSSDRASAALTLAAEHSVLRERSDGESPRMPDQPGFGLRGASPLIEWRMNTGVLAQTNVALRDVVFLTGGMRLERNGGFAANDAVTALPMLGAALVQERGDVTVKLRGAYGKGVRPQRTATRETTWVGMHDHLSRATLAPEEQSGVEAGADLFIGRTLTFQVTRFDQLASGLVQRVALATAIGSAGPPEPRRVAYQLQNMGEISNRGWEMEGSVRRGRFSLDGTLSLVESHVRQLAAGYSGDLRPGDRMLEVPSRTASLTTSWSGARWFGSVTASRASDWVNYDRAALAFAVVNGENPPPDQMGAWLRSYWKNYDGVTRLRATASRDLRRGLAVVLTGENLLNRQQGEPDNVTILPGRTITAGFRADF